jgi:hypothetical protein
MKDHGGNMDMEHNKWREMLSQKPFASLLDLPLFQEDEEETIDPKTMETVLQTVKEDVFSLFNQLMSAERHGEELYLPSDVTDYGLSVDNGDEPTASRVAQYLGTWIGEGYQEMQGDKLHLPSHEARFHQEGFYPFAGIVRIHEANGIAIVGTCWLEMDFRPFGGEVISMTAKFKGSFADYHYINIWFEGISNWPHIQKLNIYLSDDAQVFSGTYEGDGAYTLKPVCGEVVFYKHSDDPEAEL